jgi:2,3-bisphosphoglycerate-independent phosphoglycerate mutase
MKKDTKKPICLIILDGWGLSDCRDGNAIYLADTPNMDRYYKIYPNTKLNASEEAVGLPAGQMGNSEVGHLNIGAGRVVLQEFTRISKSIERGDFFTNRILLEAINNVKKNKSSLHLIGLVSDGGVHSHIGHLKALIDLATNNGVSDLYIHAFLDGRDVPPRSAVPYLKEVDRYLGEKRVGEIATVSGRYYAMDRDNRWDRTKRSYDALVYRVGEKYRTADSLVEKSYENGIDDEFVIPALVDVKSEDNAKIKQKDSLIFFNFRPDRARQLTQAFISSKFDKFNRGKDNPVVYFVCMTQYDEKFDAHIAYPPKKIKNTLGEVLMLLFSSMEEWKNQIREKIEF